MMLPCARNGMTSRERTNTTHGLERTRDKAPPITGMRSIGGGDGSEVGHCCLPEHGGASSPRPTTMEDSSAAAWVMVNQGNRAQTVRPRTQRCCWKLVPRASGGIDDGLCLLTFLPDSI